MLAKSTHRNNSIGVVSGPIPYIGIARTLLLCNSSKLDVDPGSSPFIL